jgi:hypothetical protein
LRLNNNNDSVHPDAWKREARQKGERRVRTHLPRDLRGFLWVRQEYVTLERFKRRLFSEQLQVIEHPATPQMPPSSNAMKQTTHATKDLSYAVEESAPPQPQ